MRIVRRPLAPAETDYELVGLCVTVAGLGLAAGWLALGLPWPRCIFLGLTGHPCVTCGASRSAIAFFHGNFLTALRWNPLVFAGLCALSIFDAYAFAVVTTRAPRLRIISSSSTPKNLFRALLVLSLLANWLYLLSQPAGLF